MGKPSHMTLAEAAKMIGMHPNTLRGHILRGHLKGFEVPSDCRFHDKVWAVQPEVLQAWIDAGKPGTARKERRVFNAERDRRIAELHDNGCHADEIVRVLRARFPGTSASVVRNVVYRFRKSAGRLRSRRVKEKPPQDRRSCGGS
jgi:hypothetical protein